MSSLDAYSDRRHHRRATVPRHPRRDAGGIRVNTLVVGSVAGELFDNYVARWAKLEGVNSGEVRSRLVGLNKGGRLVQLDEVAELSVWLASDASSAITGQDNNVTGG